MTIMMDGDPWRLLQEWLPPNGDPDRPRMTVSTVTAEGTADARTLLLTAFDRCGFYFHTDTRSRKVAQLAGNPAVALTLVWGFQRQLVVQGHAELAPASEIAEAYRARSPYLQQLAWLNTAEFAQLPADERHRRWKALAESRPEGHDQPPTWTGYLVRPRRLTFWHGDPDAASLRVEYTATEAGWQLSRLPG
jgi:pyridoxamine 5'-phosphate oxidase